MKLIIKHDHEDETFVVLNEDSDLNPSSFAMPFSTQLDAEKAIWAMENAYEAGKNFK